MGQLKIHFTTLISDYAITCYRSFISVCYLKSLWHVCQSIVIENSNCEKYLINTIFVKIYVNWSNIVSYKNQCFGLF